MGAFLLEGEDEPAVTVNGDGRSPYVLVCEHAGNRMPRKLGSLGLAETEITRHIAWDIGAERVARLLSRLIDAPLVLQRYSRLVYDCNRPPESPGAMPEVSETTPIPGNQKLQPEDRLARIEAIYRPFHAAVSAVLDARAAHGRRVSVVSIHSFTPVFKGKPRNFELGILHDRDTCLADRLIKGFSNVEARRNEPYGPKDGVLHTLNLHAGVRDLRHAMIEIRNDLIAQDRGQDEWAQRISVALGHAGA